MLTILTPRIMVAVSTLERLSQHNPCPGGVQSGRECYIYNWYSGGVMLALDEYVVDVLMRDLVGHDRRPVSFLVYLWLAAEQQRQGKAVTISYQQLAESVGISKSSAQAAAGWLARRKLIAVSKAGFTATPSYAVQKPWASK
jgi:hypothetical protein